MKFIMASWPLILSLVFVPVEFSGWGSVKKDDHTTAQELLNYLNTKDYNRDICLFGKNPCEELNLPKENCLLEKLMRCRGRLMDDLGLQSHFAWDLNRSLEKDEHNSDMKGDAELKAKIINNEKEKDEILSWIESKLWFEPRACFPNERSGA